MEYLDKLRRIAIISLFTDDELIDTFVLKGGNALNIAFGVNDRSSMDLDFSMKQDFGIDLQKVREKISNALERTFREENLVAFDVKLFPTPGEVRQEYEFFWGGYTLEFKVIDKERFNALEGNLESVRKNAIVMNDKQGKKMKIDISKYEYIDPKTEIELDGYTIYVYTPLMVVYEKFRALCQQVDYYSKHIVDTHRRPRPRDFFDIYTTLLKFSDMELLNLDNIDILIEMFKIKRVPLFLLEKLKDDRVFHEAGFYTVRDAVSSDVKLESFDFYFDYVLARVEEIVEVLKVNGLYEEELQEKKQI
ncbi:nucleotidyl transferase AbiEii/AbiGii toxin family protein [Peribacillus castrilensis]|uniref:nucleotidyl transferase AbiEii/AbiGii toxin family protein n=1 Tax=Peribacillus TaxID=2675229 RepID=UPI0035D0E887